MAAPKTLKTIIDDEEIKLELIEGINSKDTTKTWKAIRVQIGDYSSLVFTSKFEMTYIEKLLEDKIS